MADWQRKINLNPEWSQCKAGEITLQECARSIVVKLQAVAPFSSTDCILIDAEREELIERFADIGAETDPDRYEFDGLMTDLYDWGDTALDSKWNGKKVCWIETMLPARQKGTADVE